MPRLGKFTFSSDIVIKTKTVNSFVHAWYYADNCVIYETDNYEDTISVHMKQALNLIAKEYYFGSLGERALEIDALN